MKSLGKAIFITKRLLSLSDHCRSDKLKKRFTLLSVNYAILLTESYTIDLVKDIVKYSQFVPESDEAFNSAVKLLKILLNKLERF